jgi:hypothetical protein
VTITLEDLTISRKDGVPNCSGTLVVEIKGKKFSASWDGNCLKITPDGYQLTIKTEIPYFPEVNGAGGIGGLSAI